MNMVSLQEEGQVTVWGSSANNKCSWWLENSGQLRAWFPAVQWSIGWGRRARLLSHVLFGLWLVTPLKMRTCPK